MSASITEQIMATVFNKFALIPGQTSFRSRKAALALTEGIAIVVEPEEEPVRYLANNAAVRELLMVVRILARGEVPDSVADPIRVAMHAALMADPTVGGLCQRIVEQDTKWAYEEADLTAVSLEARYKLIYLNATNSLTTAP
jgi:hypothetical protein